MSKHKDMHMQCTLIYTVESKHRRVINNKLMNGIRDNCLSKALTEGVQHWSELVLEECNTDYKRKITFRAV
jgi:hypothetical protein